MQKPTYDIPSLPPAGELETKAVLKAVAGAHRQLAELKGRAAAIPNQGILIDTLSLQEAKASSEIENIVTTHDDLFQSIDAANIYTTPAAKEVAHYREALHYGFQEQRNYDGLLTNNMIIRMFQLLKQQDGGFRVTPGTTLRSEQDGATVYVPPQDANEIARHMEHLEQFINDAVPCDLDPLIRMALIHHQFESIHPFPDGNGRIGRIINVLYLTRQKLLDTPILYLSRSITRRKADYYHLLQAVRDTGNWEPWVLFMLNAVEETSVSTLALVEEIRQLMAFYKHEIREKHPKIYSQDLLNNLFRHPYTRIEYVQQELGVSRPTAARYLDELTQTGLLEKHQSGRNNYYINAPLVQALMRT